MASYLFIFISCLTSIVTFGGLLGAATEDRMAAIESLVAGMVVGVAYGLFSGQPLSILGSTGPILIFETILYEFCKCVSSCHLEYLRSTTLNRFPRNMDLNYLSFRLWVGIWVALIMLALVATDASALVCYITR